MVYTVEGNTSNMVKAKSYQKSAARILGYGRPNWAYAVAEENKENPPAEPIINKPSGNQPTAPTTTPAASAKKIITATTAPTSKCKEYAKTWTVATKEDPLRLRQGPGTNYRKMARMPKGTKVKCDGSYSGAWLYVTYETKSIIYKGFAIAKHLK